MKILILIFGVIYTIKSSVIDDCLENGVDGSEFETLKRDFDLSKFNEYS